MTSNHSGYPIVQNGIFTEGCVYGKNESLSDHAPVIYGQLGTWNMAQKATDFQLPGLDFYFHKFKYTAENEVINESDHDYLHRLSLQASKIHYLFEQYQLKLMTLQEVPLYKDQQKHLKKELKKYRLSVIFAGTKKQKEEKVADVALVVPTEHLRQYSIYSNNHKIRALTMCNEKDNRCYMSVHLKMAQTDQDLQDQCHYFMRLKDHVLRKNFKQLEILGDFNRDLESYHKACEGLFIKKNVKVMVDSFLGDGQSCHDNDGHHNPANVDLYFKL